MPEDTKANEETKPNQTERFIDIVPNDNELSGIVTNKPTQVAKLNAQAALGNVTAFVQAAFDAQEKVGQIKHALNSRTSEVASLPVVFLPADDSDRAAEIAKAIQDIWDDIPRHDEILRDMTLAIYYGFYLGQIIYTDQLVDGLWKVKSIDTIPLRFLSFRDENGVTNYPRLKTKDFSTYGKALEPFADQLIFHCVSQQGSCLLGGLARTLLWYALFASFDTKSWITFAEINGIPIRIGKLPTNATPAEKSAMKRALSNIGKDASGIISLDSIIEFIESNKKSSSDVFKDLMKWITDTIDKVTVGQTKTSDGDSGSRALGDVHKDTLDTLTTATKTSIEESLQLQFVLPVTITNFGTDAASLAPKIRLVFKSTKQQAAVEKSIKDAYEMETPIPLSYMLKTFSIPEAADGEAVIQKNNGGDVDQSLVAAMDKLIASTGGPGSWLR